MSVSRKTQRGWYGIDAMQRWRADQQARNRGAELDVVLMTHPRDENDLVRLFPWAQSMSLDERRVIAQHLRPVFGEVISADNLNVGLLFMPLFAHEIMNPRTRRQCRDVLKYEGMQAIRTSGAKVVCLGGLLGGLSGYGRHLDHQAEEMGVTVTTGHSLTAISVLQTYLRAVRELNMAPAERELAVLGVGSVGWGFARLLSHEKEVPRKVTLIDTPRRARHLEQHAEELRARGRFEVATETTSREGVLADDSASYRSSFLISAVSMPNVVDIHKVAAGTVLVDDSQPYCWSRDEAWQRCRDQLDIVPCEAGLIDVDTLGYRSHFPFDFADHDRMGGSRTAWCCLTEGLLRALHPHLPPTRGEPTEDTLHVYSEAFRECGLKPAELQCGPHPLPVDALRQRIGDS
ncbi:hypothetical protein QQM79_14665 [Marinobacteraceae bacterium S3BR75-40.1]